jgi:hypothetical protein
MYVLVLDTETTGLFPRGAASTPLQPPLCPSAPRGAASIPRGGDKRPPQTPSAPILNPSTQGGFKGGSAPLPLPYAVQISYAIIDTSSPFFPIVEDYDAIIRISEETPLPEESVKIHGITREMIRAKGVPIEHVLSILQRSLDTYDVQLVVGHNIAFDLRVIETERGRLTPPSSSEGATSAHYAVPRPPLCPSPSSSPDPTSTPEGATSTPFNPSVHKGLRPDIYSNTFAPTPQAEAEAGGLRGLCPLSNTLSPSRGIGGDEVPLPDSARRGLRGRLTLPSLCTARESVGVCNLRVESMYGGTYLKFGKLGQVFEILFKERDAARGVDMKVFEKYMHNSRVDVLMCARVYVWLCYSVDVFDAWYCEMQNYADSDFINVDDAHLVVGGVERPLRPLCVGCVETPSPVASPRRSDRLRLKRMREQVSIPVM